MKPLIAELKKTLQKSTPYTIGRDREPMYLVRRSTIEKVIRLAKMSLEGKQ